MFEFRYHTNDLLPKLAWLAAIDKKTGTVDVYCGSKVEQQKDFFTAGVWSGKFSEGSFDSAEYFLGSGVKRGNNEELLICTASHGLEKLFLAEEDTELTASNSVPFLLSYHHYSLDTSNDQYEASFCSILDGLKKYQPIIPMKDNKQIRQYFASNIRIDGKLHITIEKKPQMKPFESFQDFYGRLMDDMTAIRDNAASSNRSNGGFGLVTTISSGYDSCACAAVAKTLGCTTAVSLAGGKYDLDSGEEAARQMGYKRVIKRQQSSYQDKSDLEDVEYVCSGELGTHLQFSVFEDIFADNLVFMGLRGDYYWGKETVANNDLEMVDFFYYEANIGYIENALKNGYIVIPLPTFGCTVSTSVRKISNSKEMEPWTLHNDYDRPIPRRIVESIGVSRESFGQKKSGGGFSFGYDNAKRLRRKMTRKGYAAFSEFLRDGRNHRGGCRKILHSIEFHGALLPTYMNLAGRKVGINIHCKQKALRIANPGAAADLIFWSMQVMTGRYSKALAQEAKALHGCNQK